MTTHNTPDKQGEALPPCPFCGASAFTSWDGDTDSPNDWSVNCDNTIECGATVGGMSSEAEAIKAWSRRVAAVEGDAQAKRNDFNVTEWRKCFDRLMGTVPYSDEQPLRDEIKHASRVIDLLYKEVQSLRTAAASSPAPAEPPHLCLLCGHNGVSPDGTCLAPVPICGDEYHGTRRCGCKCRFAAPAEPLQPTGEQENQ